MTDTTGTGATRPSFMELLRSGAAVAHDADRFAEAWHEAPEGSAEAAMSLPDFLGMTADEYAAWVKDPASLRALGARIPPEVIEEDSKGCE